MAKDLMPELLERAAAASEPTIVGKIKVGAGGVDPLGLRQTNFDLMDEVLPDLNNVARHIRPFVVVAWAWRRAKEIAEQAGAPRVKVEAMRDFVDRIEVIYVWSQFLRDAEADLPGRRVMRPLMEAQTWTFGGKAWSDRRETRRDSTSLSSALNYGPSLRSLGWIAPLKEQGEVMIALPSVEPALKALEQAMGPTMLAHPAFSQFGVVSVSAEEARAWGERWALNMPCQTERVIAAKLIFQEPISAKRREGTALMFAALQHVGKVDGVKVREAMAGAPSSFRASNALAGSATKWRAMQERQLFRFALESLLYWLIWKLEKENAPRTTAELVAAFKTAAGGGDATTSRRWLVNRDVAALGPVGLMNALEQELNYGTWDSTAAAIVDALAFCLLTARAEKSHERDDRLPIARAQRDAEVRANEAPEALITHIVEGWVLAQHVYWSVGRGLADARQPNGKTLLRLKIVLEEGGWTLAPGTVRGAVPSPTPDRLETALTLAHECGLIE